MTTLRLLACIAIALLAFAPATQAQSLLRVTTTTGIPVSLSINGRHFSRHSDTLSIDNLPPGRHYVCVYALSQTRRGRNMDNAIYRGYVHTRTGGMATVIVNPLTGSAYISHGSMAPPDINEPEEFKQRTICHGLAPQTPQPADTATTAKPNTPAPAPTTTGKTYTHLPTTKELEAIEADTDKLLRCKNISPAPSLTTATLITLMNTMNFESTRYELATAYYPYIADKNNFNTLLNQFNLPEYRAQFKQFINDHH